MQFTTVKPIARFSLTVLLCSSAAISGCSDEVETPTAEVVPTPVVKASPAPTAAAPASPAAPKPLVEDPLVAAEDVAQGAIALTQSAVSAEDWNIIVQQWERAILLLESVPESDPKIATVRDKLAGYRSNLASAREQAKQSATSPQSDAPSLPSDAIIITGKDDKASSTSVAPEDTAKFALAQHLAETGAQFYASKDCNECEYQRQAFGSAANQLTEMACAATDEAAANDPCKKAGVAAVPAWKVKGKLYPGIRSLDELATLSGYEGDRDFNPARSQT